MQRSASKLKPIAPRPAPSGSDAGARTQTAQQQQQQQQQQAGVPPGAIAHHHHPGVPPGAVAVQIPYPPPGFHPHHHPHPAYAMAMPIAHPPGAPHPAYAVHPHAAAVAAGYHHHLPHHTAVVSAAPQQQQQHHAPTVHATPVHHHAPAQQQQHQQQHPQLIQSGPPVSLDPRDYVWGTPAGAGQQQQQAGGDQAARSRAQTAEAPQTQQLTVAHHHQHPGTLALPQHQPQQQQQHYAIAVSGHMQQPGVMFSYTAPGARPMAIPMAIPQHLHSMPYAVQHASGAMLHAQQPLTSQPQPVSQPMPALLTSSGVEHPQQRQQPQASSSGSGQQILPEAHQVPERTQPSSVADEQRGSEQQQQHQQLQQKQEHQQQQRACDVGETSMLLGGACSSGGLSLEERGSSALMMDEDIDLDETLKKLLESDDTEDHAGIMSADGMKLMDGTSPSDQSTGTGARMSVDEGHRSGEGLLGQSEEPNFDSWHQGIYAMHANGELDELDLDFANTLESVELSSTSRPMKRAKSMASLAGGLKKVHSQDNLLLNVSQPQALRAIRTFLTKSSLPDDQRNAALNVLELLKQQGNQQGVEDSARSASETGLSLSTGIKRNDSTSDLFK